MIIVDNSPVTTRELEHATSRLDAEVRGRRCWGGPRYERGRPLVGQGKDADHVHVQAFGLDIQVRFRGSP